MELNQREKEVVEKLIQMGSDYRINNGRSIFRLRGIAKNGEEIILKYLKYQGERNGFLVKTQNEDNNFPFKIAWYDDTRGKLSNKRVMTDIELLVEWDFYKDEDIIDGFNRLLLTSSNIPSRVYICNLGRGNNKVNDWIAFFDEAVESCKAVSTGESFVCLIGARYHGDKDFVVHKVVKK